MQIQGSELHSVSGAARAITSALGGVANIAWEPKCIYLCRKGPQETWIVIRLPWRISVVVKFHLVWLKNLISEPVWLMERPRFSFRPIKIVSPMNVVSIDQKREDGTGSQEDQKFPGP